MVKNPSLGIGKIGYPNAFDNTPVIKLVRNNQGIGI